MAAARKAAVSSALSAVWRKGEGSKLSPTLLMIKKQEFYQKIPVQENIRPVERTM